MKIKLDENLPAKLKPVLQRHGHDVDTAPEEHLSGRPDAEIWQAVCSEGRFLITQDLDFSDTRRFAPGTHAGLLLVRLREPGVHALMDAISSIAAEITDWGGCFVVLTEHKVRIKRPCPWMCPMACEGQCLDAFTHGKGMSRRRAPQTGCRV